MQRSEKGNDFRIGDLDKESFEDFKISTSYAQYQYASGYIITLPPPGLESASNSQNY